MKKMLMVFVCAVLVGMTVEVKAEVSALIKKSLKESKNAKDELATINAILATYAKNENFNEILSFIFKNVKFNSVVDVVRSTSRRFSRLAPAISKSAKQVAPEQANQIDVVVQAATSNTGDAGDSSGQTGDGNADGDSSNSGSLGGDTGGSSGAADPDEQNGSLQ